VESIRVFVSVWWSFFWASVGFSLSWFLFLLSSLLMRVRLSYDAIDCFFCLLAQGMDQGSVFLSF